MSSIWSRLSLSSSLDGEGNFLSSLKFQSCLGLGGFGIVLQAIGPTISTNPYRDPTDTAVKFIFPSEESDPKEEKQLVREAQLASTFRHRNIVQVFNVAEKQLKANEIEKIFKNLSKDDKRSLSFRDLCLGKAKRYKTVRSIAIQMELCGETIRKWLNQSRDPKEDQVTWTSLELKILNQVQVQKFQIRICRGIVNGLKYLHDQKIIHRDLKPENIMFSEVRFTLPVKIGDFGLCRTLHSTESYTSSLTSRTGTLEYMAPEAYSKVYTFQVDFFSLGLVIWEVIQLIKFTERRSLFDALINDKEVDLIQVPEIFGVMKKGIINLTRKKTTERAQSLDEVVKIVQEIYHNVIGQARTVEKLEKSLMNVKVGGKIVLGECVLKGEFVLKADGVEIVGQGPKRTVLKGLKGTNCLTVSGSNCTISGIAIIPGDKMYSNSKGICLTGSQNRLHNVEVSGGETCIDVSGHENGLEHLTISNAFHGIQVHGSNNTLHQIQIEDIGYCGIGVDGSKNSLSHIHILRGRDGRRINGVLLSSSVFFNTISNLTCSGYSRDNEDWALKMNSPDSSVQDSDCGPVLVRGKESSLSNVKCGDEISIMDNSTGVKLTKCRGRKLVFYTTVVATDCHFDKIVDNGPLDYRTFDLA